VAVVLVVTVNVNVALHFHWRLPQSSTMANTTPHFNANMDPDTGVNKSFYPETKGIDSPLEQSSSHSNGGSVESDRPSLMTRLGITPESFKRRTLADQHNQLNKTLKTRHLNMIAIGGSIGAGLFVGSGGALAKGGPASLLICFSIIGIVSIMWLYLRCSNGLLTWVQMMFNVVYALGEMAMLYPISGGFYTYSVRFIDPSWGFAMGWNYVFQWVSSLDVTMTVLI
jgi:amino acid transporter